MRVPLRLVGAALVMVALTTAAIAQKPADPTAADLLKAGSRYAVEYSSKLTGVTLEEQFLLVDVSARIMVAPSRIASDVVFIRLSPEGDIVGLRDLFAIDNRKIREREPRIVTALAEPTTANWLKAQAYSREHAIYFVADVVLWFIDPVQALQFIAEPNQSRMTYKLEGTKKMNGVQVYGLGFKEIQKPGQTYLFDMPGNPFASGRFWIDPATGAIHMTELWAQSDADTARVQVTYAPDAKLGILLPRDATHNFENREIGSGGVVGPISRKMTFDASAKYSNPRYAPLDLSRIAR